MKNIISLNYYYFFYFLISFSLWRLPTCVYLDLHILWRPLTADLCIFSSPDIVETTDLCIFRSAPLYIITNCGLYSTLKPREGIWLKTLAHKIKKSTI